MPLHLRYAFTPAPNPIRASIGGANPNLVTLQVMISNPSPNPAAMGEISITIPVGREGAGALSDSPSLPAPVYDPSGGWVASSAGSTVTLVPGPGGLTNSFLFTLPGIAVNGTPGVVPLTIVELAPPAPKVIDSTTYSLTKFEADFPVTNFYATPSTLDNLHEPVTLYWECSDQGQQFVYSVHSDSWQPGDCLDGGQCLSCADGQQGVETPPLDRSTIFTLDVIQTNPNGGRSIYQKLYTPVRVLVPYISRDSYLEELFSGLVVRLHWLAFNAAYCTVQLDGRVIDKHAPTDTYELGYQVILWAQEDPHQLVVTAHAASGPAQSQFIFPNVYTGQSNVPVGSNPYAVAVTPDSSLALVTRGAEGMGDGSLVVVDLNTLTTEGHAISVGSLSSSIAVTPDGALALVPSCVDGNMTVIDIAERTAEANRFQVGVSLSAIAVTPDGKLALVASFNNDQVAVVDIAARQTEAQSIGVGTSPVAVAVTPDGKLALVMNQNSGDLSVIDIAGRRVANNSTWRTSGRHRRHARRHARPRRQQHE